MKKTIMLFLLSVTIVFTIARCNNNSMSDFPFEPADINEPENPFRGDASNTTMMGRISHGPRNPNVDKNEMLLPLIYVGEEIQYDYYVNASGQAKNVGFLMFVDGIPQPYKIGLSDASYEYMHIFNLESDNVDLPVTFIFSPVTGVQGDNLRVDITSVYNPSFKPDMKKTTSYGGYHAMLTASYSLHYEADAPAINDSDSEIYGVAAFSNEPVTNQLLETISNMSMLDIDMDTFNREIFSLLYFDGEIKSDNIHLSDGATMRVQYILCGRADLEYETTFFINHQPIASSQGISHNSVIKKGAVTVITLDLGIDKLEDSNTFYIVSVPINASDYPDEIFEPIKTESILLYK